MVSSTKDHRSASTRRQFLRLGAVSGTLLVAGCMSGTDDSGGSNGGGDGRTFRVFDPLTSKATPTDRHLNPWNGEKTGCWHPGAAIMDRLAVYAPTVNEAYPLMAKSWEKSDDTTLSVTLDDRWTWHNGDQFVADDYVMEQQIELEILQYTAEEEGRERPHQVMESIEAVDDTHFEITLHDPLDPVFAVQNTIGSYHGNLGRGVFTKHTDEKWQEWHERLQNTSGDEKGEVVAEITGAAYPKINSDNAIGHGPFKIADVGDDIITMEIYEDHPNAANIEIDEFQLKLFSQDQPTQPYSQNKVDASHKGFPVPEDQRSSLPDEHTLFREGRSSNKLFAFNCGHGVDDYDTPFESPNVRKAVAHIFDKKQVETLLKGVNRVFEWPACRLPGKVLREDSHESTSLVKDNFTTYGTNDTERAAELLRMEDYSQNGDGQWMTPDGSPFEITIMNGAERPDITLLSENLKQFGIQATIEQVDDATMDQNRIDGHYDLMPDGSSANGVTALWALGLVPDWIQSITHFQPTREIPMPIGDPEGNSGTKEINIEEHIRQWQVTGESKYHHELMWWWNQTLPEVEMMYQPDAGGYNSANWELDVKDEIRNGVDDALYIATKVEDGSLKYVGD